MHLTSENFMDRLCNCTLLIVKVKKPIVRRLPLIPQGFLRVFYMKVLWSDYVTAVAANRLQQTIARVEKKNKSV